jgi:hypothetical protein
MLEPNDDQDCDQYGQQQQQPRQPTSTLNWQSIFHSLLALVAVVTHICYWYGDFDRGSGSDYPISVVNHHLPSLPSTTSWFQNLWPYDHVLPWLASHPSQEQPPQNWMFPYKWMLQNRNEKQTLNLEAAPLSSSSSSTIIQLHGQDLALKIVEQRLQQHWNQPNKMVVTLYLAGGGTSSIGKTSLVYRLLEQMIVKGVDGLNALDVCRTQWQGVDRGLEMVESDDSPLATNLSRPPCPLIRINPADYAALDDSDGLSSLLKSNPLLSKQSDLIILLSSVDEWTRGSTGSGSGSDPATPYDDAKLHSLLKEIQQARSAPTCKTLVVMTSNVGSVTQDKWLRRQLQQQRQLQLNDGLEKESHKDASDDYSSSDSPSPLTIPESIIKKELIPLLDYEIRQFHGHLDGHDKTDWTIVPFDVLDRNAMSMILLDFIYASSRAPHPVSAAVTSVAPFRFHITDSGMDRLLDDHLEWYQWIHKTSSSTLRKWSPSGASQLVKLWNDRVNISLEQQYTKQRQLGQQQQQQPSNGCIVMDNDADDDLTTGTATAATTLKMETVLDVDEGTADRFVLRSCYPMHHVTNDNHRSDDDTSSDGSGSSSSTSCHGRTVRAVIRKESSYDETYNYDGHYDSLYCCPVDRPSCRFYI